MDYLSEVVSHLSPAQRRDVLAVAGLTEVSLHDASLRIDQARYRELYDVAVKAGDDELFGFFQRPVPRGTFASLLRMLTQCRDVRGVVHASNEMYGLFDRHLPWAFHESGGRATLALVPRTERQASSALYTQQMLRTPLTVISWLVGHRLRARHAELDRRLVRFAGELAYLVGVRPRVSNRSAWTMDSSTLDLAIVRSAADVDPWLRASLASIIGGPGRSTLEDRVRRVLADAQPVGALDLGRAASMLRMSRATLARRLNQVGHTFLDIKDAVRRELALTELARPEGTVESVAATLGYRDARSFRRAFARWTGRVPSDYRPPRSAR